MQLLTFDFRSRHASQAFCVRADDCAAGAVGGGTFAAAFLDMRTNMAFGVVVAVGNQRFNHLVLLGRAAVRVWG